MAHARRKTENHNGFRPAHSGRKGQRPQFGTATRICLEATGTCIETLSRPARSIACAFYLLPWASGYFGEAALPRQPVTAGRLPPFDQLVPVHEILEGTDEIVARMGIQPLRSVTRTDDGTVIKERPFSIDGLRRLEFDDRSEWCAYSAKSDDHQWSRRDQEKFDVVRSWLAPLGISYRVLRPSDIPIALRKNAELLLEGFRAPPEEVSDLARTAITSALRIPGRRPLGKILGEQAREHCLSLESVRKTAFTALLNFEVEVDLLAPIMLDRPLPEGEPHEAISLLKSIFMGQV
jgi:hypothetical protein